MSDGMIHVVASSLRLNDTDVVEQWIDISAITTIRKYQA
jgi:hypothetical protein